MTACAIFEQVGRTLMWLAVSLSLVGCAASNSALRYAEVLDAPQTPLDVVVRVQKPSPPCVEQARHVVHPSDILDELPTELRADTNETIRGLHPIAKQVLRQIGGIWFARELSGADARFIPCDGSDHRLGLILVDASASFPARDVRVPHLYWELLGGTTEVSEGAPAIVERTGRGLRYVLIHELGHALSLLAGEFSLGSERQFELETWDRFLAFSWRGRYGRYPLGGELHASGGVVPNKLALGDWQHVRRAIGSSATWLVPGYERPRRPHTADFCNMVHRLPGAGFVTPTAALSPMEDYAELFAHAILADEGKITPGETIAVTLDACTPTSLPNPYFAQGLRAKRHYLESHLRL